MIIKLAIATMINNPNANPLIRRRVNALKIGHFAIHKSDVVWTVSHINSGYYLRNFFNPVSARKYAEFLNSLPVEWRRIHSKKDALKMIPRDSKKASREFALSLDDRLPSSIVFPKRGTEPQS